MLSGAGRLAAVTQVTMRLAAALLAADVMDAALWRGGCTLSLNLVAAGALRVPGDAHLAARKRRQALAPACGPYASCTRALCVSQSRASGMTGIDDVLMQACTHWSPVYGT